MMYKIVEAETLNKLEKAINECAQEGYRLAGEIHSRELDTSCHKFTFHRVVMQKDEEVPMFPVIPR